jgi:hypothetical protein
MFCTQCGKAITDEDSFCTNCSAEINSSGGSTPAEVEVAASQPKRIRGGLLFLCLFFTIGAPCYFLRNLALALWIAQSSMLAYVFIGFQVVLTLLSLRVGIKLWRLDSDAVKSAKAFLVFCLCYAIGEFVVMVALSSALGSEQFLATLRTASISLVLAVSGATAGILYLKRSRRVKATFDRSVLTVRRSIRVVKRIGGTILVLAVLGVFAWYLGLRWHYGWTSAWMFGQSVEAVRVRQYRLIPAEVSWCNTDSSGVQTADSICYWSPIPAWKTKWEGSHLKFCTFEGIGDLCKELDEASRAIPLSSVHHGTVGISAMTFLPSSPSRLIHLMFLYDPDRTFKRNTDYIIEVSSDNPNSMPEDLSVTEWLTKAWDDAEERGNPPIMLDLKVVGGGFLPYRSGGSFNEDLAQSQKDLVQAFCLQGLDIYDYDKQDTRDYRIPVCFQSFDPASPAIRISLGQRPLDEGAVVGRSDLAILIKNQQGYFIKRGTEPSVSLETWLSQPEINPGTLAAIPASRTLPLYFYKDSHFPGRTYDDLPQAGKELVQEFCHHGLPVYQVDGDSSNLAVSVCAR